VISKPDGRRGLVADIDVGAERLFVGPVEVGIDGFDAGPFEEADQGSRWQNTSGITRNSLASGYSAGTILDGGKNQSMLVADAGLQCVLHSVSFIQYSRENRGPRLPAPG